MPDANELRDLWLRIGFRRFSSERYFLLLFVNWSIAFGYGFGGRIPFRYFFRSFFSPCLYNEWGSWERWIMGSRTSFEYSELIKISCVDWFMVDSWWKPFGITEGFEKRRFTPFKIYSTSLTFVYLVQSPQPPPPPPPMPHPFKQLIHFILVNLITSTPRLKR